VDQRLTESKLTAGRNFTNKLWNAARFVLSARPETDAAPGESTLAARWMRSRLARATEQATRQLDALDIAGYAATVYEVAWSDYCDWYLEMAKVELRREGATDAERAATWQAAAEGMARLLGLLHPLMPFVTEEIWDALRVTDASLIGGHPLLVRAPWPTADGVDPEAEATFDSLAALVRGLRNLRTDAGIPAGAWVPIVIDPTGTDAARSIRELEPYVSALARVRPIDTDAAAGPLARGAGERVLVVDDEEALVAVTSEVLKRIGYEPLGCADGEAALAAFEEVGGRIDAVIADEVMPGLSGTQLARALRRRRADLPVVLVSGYTGPMLSERALAAGVTEILKKPVQSRDLAAALARALKRS